MSIPIISDRKLGIFRNEWNVFKFWMEIWLRLITQTGSVKKLQLKLADFQSELKMSVGIFSLVSIFEARSSFIEQIFLIFSSVYSISRKKRVFMITLEALVAPLKCFIHLELIEYWKGGSIYEEHASNSFEWSSILDLLFDQTHLSTYRFVNLAESLHYLLLKLASILLNHCSTTMYYFGKENVI